MKAVLWICTALLAGLYIVGPIQDPDLWWHITVGRWILAHGEIPHQDLWGRFSYGEPWRAYSWTNEIVYAAVDGAWGVHGLLTLKLILGAILGVSLGVVCSKLGKDWFLGLVLGVFATTACFNHFTLRPQSLVWVLFAWLLVVLDRVEREGLGRSEKFGLVILMSLWANTHLSAVLGVATVGLWSFGDGLPRRPALTRAAHATSWAILGTLLTPYLGGEWLTFFAKSGHPLEFRAIAEFQPATVTQYSTAFLVLSALILVVLAIQGGRVLSPARLLLWSAFLLGSLAVIKFLPFAVILTCALIARALREMPPKPSVRPESLSLAHGNLREALERFRAFCADIPREGLSFVFICISVVNVYKVWRDPLALEVVPKQAVDFIEEHQLPHPIANIFGHGGYLMYRFSDSEGVPVQRVAIDGRTNLISKEMWKKYNATYSGKRSWREYLGEVEPETILWRDDSPLGSILIADGNWCEVFAAGPERSRVVVFVKRSFYEAHHERLSGSSCDVKA